MLISILIMHDNNEQMFAHEKSKLGRFGLCILEKIYNTQNPAKHGLGKDTGTWFRQRKVRKACQEFSGG